MVFTSPRLVMMLLLSAVTLANDVAAQTTTITASDCSFSAVQNAINGAPNGAAVVIPSGSCTWTTGISTTKQIVISGQSKGSVLITHSAGSGTLFDLTTGASFTTEVRNINFLPGTGTGRYLEVHGSGKPPLIHDNYFLMPNFQLLAAITFGRNGGVIYKNTIESLTASGLGGVSGSGSSAIQLKDFSSGASWSAASTMGMADVNGTANVYLEDNVFSNMYATVIDCDDNARAVIRYNTFNDSAIVCHGADTSPYGVRHTEVYNNRFVFHASGSNGPITYPLNLNDWWYVRGGSGIFADNVVDDINSGYWGNKPELQFIVQNLRRNAGPYPCWTTYPAPHQIGQSYNGSATVTEPLYIWGNTGTGSQTPARTDYNPDECLNGLSTTQFVQANRDYVVGTPKPGYTKYTYPHPLRSSGGGTITPPAAPTNLHIVR